jgi:hypothetical protein
MARTEPFPPTVTKANLGSVTNLQTICDWLKKSNYLTASLDTNPLSVPSRLIDVMEATDNRHFQVGVF